MEFTDKKELANKLKFTKDSLKICAIKNCDGIFTCDGFEPIHKECSVKCGRACGYCGITLCHDHIKYMIKELFNNEEWYSCINCKQ
jgi:hypothetical protein